MTRLLTYLYSALCAGILLTVSSCSDVREEEGVSMPEPGGKVQIEMFTRLGNFDVPVSRAAADENGLDMTPWVLIFRDESTTQNGQADAAMFVEAVKTVEIGISKRYVWLEHQTKQCWALLLANPQDVFYTNAVTGYAFTEANLNDLLAGKTLAQATAMLLTKPLPATVTSMPFIGEKMPMSYLHPMPRGVNKDATIGSSTTPLALVRVPAKVVIENKASRFTLDAVLRVMNVSGQSQLHNLAAAPPEPGTRVNYIPVSGDLITPETDGTTQTTKNYPIYMYETPNSATDYSYIIIKGTYRVYWPGDTPTITSSTSYYKLRFVDPAGQPIDIKRNHEYTFDITEVRGVGYSTLDEAIAGLTSNDIQYEIVVTDPSAYEIMANSDYYVALSNSKAHLYVYQGTTDLHIATLIIYNTSTPISITSAWYASNIISPPNGVIPPATNRDTPQQVDIIIQTQAGYQDRIMIQIGDVQTEWYIEVTRQDPMDYRGTTPADWKPYYYYDDRTHYFMLSGEVDNPLANSWIKLSTADNVFRNNPQSIMVDDGKIHMHVDQNSEGQTRRATAMFTALRNPGWDYENTPGTYRVKFIMDQLGQ